MYESRQQRRNREAEARRHHWDNYPGPWVKASTLADRDARINRPAHP